MVVTLGASKLAFRVLSDYFSPPVEAKTRLKFRTPLCTLEFDKMLITLLEPLNLDPPIWKTMPSSGRMVSRSWSIVAKNCCKTMELCKPKAKNGFINLTIEGYLAYTPWDTLLLALVVEV